MRNLLWICFLLIGCEPIPQKTLSRDQTVHPGRNLRQRAPEIERIGTNIQSVNNPALDDYHLEAYESTRKGGCIGRRDDNITPFSPLSYTYILDTLILRWDIWNKSVDYTLKISNAYDQDYANLQVDQRALMLHTPYFETYGAVPGHGVFFLLHFRRTSNHVDFCGGKTLIFSSEASARRKQMLDTLHSSEDVADQVELLLRLNYPVDALTLIELHLLKNEDPLLQEKYWEIANGVLIDANKPSVER